jgi:small-conductance mechanosensitive channel
MSYPRSRQGFSATAGISGVAIALPSRHFAELLAGILILLTEPFQINDQIAFKGFEERLKTSKPR